MTVGADDGEIMGCSDHDDKNGTAVITLQK